MITKLQYDYALKRIDELLPLVDENDLTDKRTIELSILSDLVIE